MSVAFARGFQATGLSCGIKTSPKPDLALLKMNPPAQTFGCFTKNAFRAPPVVFCQQVLQSDPKISLLLVNSGNANAGTGQKGTEDVYQTEKVLRQNFQSEDARVLICSTGLIGEPLPMEKLTTGIEKIFKGGASTFEEAILTTDSGPKSATKTLILRGSEVRIGGSAKGAGMISPNMATMLAFVTTDLELPHAFKSRFLSIMDKSFNSISVDGDMSTNDSAFLFSNGLSQVSYSQLSEKEQNHFCDELLDLCQTLAKKIVSDGEGATKLIEIRVRGAADPTQAKMAAKAIGDSQLVKTACFGKDPNWGRILAAVGAQPVLVRPEKCTISLNGINVLENGKPVYFKEESLKSKMEMNELIIDVDLDVGSSQWTCWASDLTFDYVKINACYHT